MALTNVDLHELFGIHNKMIALIFGLVIVGGYFAPDSDHWLWKHKSMPKILEKMGMVRYSIVAFLFLSMMALPIKKSCVGPSTSSMYGSRPGSTFSVSPS